MLGLSVSNFTEVSAELVNIESDNENDFEEIVQQDEPEDDPSSDESLHINNYNNELVKNDNIISPLKNIDEFQDETNEVQVPKRPFLKRGVGLTSRFRIAPDAFNLKKLPPYKYADRVNKNLARKAKPVTKDPLKESEPPKRQKPQRAEPVKKKAEAESSELSPPDNLALKIPQETIALSEPEPHIEEWFKSRQKEKQPEMAETPKVAKPPKGVSWAQMLNANNISDSSIQIDPQSLGDDPEMNDTSLFHLLEEKVHNMSIDMSMSSIMKLVVSLQHPRGSQDEDRTLVNPEDPLIDAENSVNVQLEPHPSDVNKKIVIDDTTDEEEDEEDHHVRFADNVEVVEDATDLSTDIDAIELSQTSTPNERQKFHDFQRRLMGNQKPPDNRNELQQKQFKEKSEQMRTKLAELEEQISTLHQQNANINKIKHDLELDRLQLENDREDMIEQMKDDRIKMELQLHDERLKLDQEKMKIEKMLKTPSKKEREEIAKLKETVDELREELKTKEIRHGSASARYRSQVKQLEKENQTLKLELDVAKKDNKKLELENARLRKDTNNKMLQEINRNIAKLAPADVKKQPEPAKKTRKSDPVVVKKRVKSVPEQRANVSSDSSEDEETSSHSRRSSKENNPVRVRRSAPTSSSEVLAEMKREIENSDGSKDIWYPNGNLKKISPDGMLIRMLYYNKDIKETNVTEGTVKYYYNETNTWHTTYIDGLEILEYPE